MSMSSLIDTPKRIKSLFTKKKKIRLLNFNKKIILKKENQNHLEFYKNIQTEYPLFAKE